jgi:predicted nucleic acid-binding protein
MKEKVFVDSDIILDVLLERKPFVEPAAELLDLGQAKSVDLFTSAVVLANTFYVLRKTIGFEEAKKNLKKLRLLLHVLPIHESTVDAALGSKFSDFEDGLQYFSAKENSISTLITRNIKDYKVKDLVIQTAEEYVRSL